MAKIIRLNLGCGHDLRAGWINIDAIADCHPDMVHDLRQPLPFSDNSVDGILAQDILEHFTKEDVMQVVAEISRVLKIGGQLEVRVPNIDDIMKRFAKDQETRNEFIYGTTLQTGIWGAHKVGFTQVSLLVLMMKHDLVIESFATVETNFVAHFKKIKKSKHSKKLLMINQTLGMGGAEVFLTDLLAGLKRLNWKITVYTNNKLFIDLLATKQIKAKKINTIVDPIGNLRGLIKASVLWPVLLFEYWQIIFREKKSDVFLTSGYIEKILFTPLAALFAIPVCWIEFGPMATIFEKFWRLPKVLYFLVKALPERVVTSSDHSKCSLTSVSRISLAKLAVIPCGRDIAAAANFKDIKRNLIVCVSRLEPGKGQDLLIKAFKKVEAIIPSARLRLVGMGDSAGLYAATLKKIAKQNGVADKVEFVGFVPDALSEIAQAKVVVFPSVWSLEGFGLVMIEAMSLGKGVVAFDHGPVSEIVHHGETGLLARKADVDDLAAQIIRMLKSKKLRQSLGQSALLRFQEHYQLAPVASRYDEVLQETIYLKKAKALAAKI